MLPAYHLDERKPVPDSLSKVAVNPKVCKDKVMYQAIKKAA